MKKTGFGRFFVLTTNTMNPVGAAAGCDLLTLT
jgi:hypothetical protein